MNIIDKIVEETKELDISALLVGGTAEGTLHPQIIEILKKLKTIHSLMDFILMTNGTALTKDLIQCIVDLQITKVFFSLDAATPETYKNIRGGDLKKVEQNILSLIDEKKKRNSIFPLVRVSFVVQDANKKEKTMFLNKWKNKVDIVDFQKLYPYAEPIAESSEYKFGCREPFRQIQIDYEGNMYPCCNMKYMKHLCLGNINKMTIKEYWNSEVFKNFVNAFQTEAVNMYCKDCNQQTQKKLQNLY